MLGKCHVAKKPNIVERTMKNDMIPLLHNPRTTNGDQTCQ